MIIFVKIVWKILKQKLNSHLTTIEKPNEKLESLEDIILLLYESQIKHFSLIKTKDIKTNIKFYSTKNKKCLELEDYTIEEVKKYVKSYDKIIKNLKFIKMIILKN